MKTYIVGFTVFTILFGLAGIGSVGYRAITHESYVKAAFAGEVR
jgi:hypothetical protein